ncbi:MAG: DUF3108 domain-containing protein [Sphingobacteriales bacterium]|nr:MAG: DUF3108 domain-containing protein [Sphingobacteriales bacterium]
MRLSFLPVGFLLSSLLLLQNAARAQNDCISVNTAWMPGEKLRFKAWYNMSPLWVGAGEATFEVGNTTLNSRPTYHFVGEGRTLKSYEWFFKVRDRYESFVDAETLRPVRFVRQVNEGSIHFTEPVTFDQVGMRAVSPKKATALPRCYQDVISTLYYARNIDFARYAPGSRIPIKMYLEDKIYDFYVKYLGKEKVQTRYGTFNALKLAPLLIEGNVFKEGGEKMTLWISDDANRLPLRINSPVVVGSVKVDLMGFEGLRNPLTSLISRRGDD